MKNDIIQKAQLTKLFFKALFRKENFMTGYSVKTTQGSVTWAFIAGALVYAGASWISWTDPLLIIGAFVIADALNACWIGMKKNGLFHDPAQVLEEIS